MEIYNGDKWWEIDSSAVISAPRGLIIGGGSAHGSNLTRSVNHDSGAGNIIEYVTIATTGNTTDFGDLTRSSLTNVGLDNSNGSIA